MVAWALTWGFLADVDAFVWSGVGAGLRLMLIFVLNSYLTLTPRRVKRPALSNAVRTLEY